MALQTLSGRKASQDEAELRSFLDLLTARDVRSYLEIGARHGDTFYEVMRRLPPGSIGVAVDLPGGAWGTESSVAHLKHACNELRSLGYRIHMVLGDSGSERVIERVSQYGPYDAILIDGDHRYEGVKRDWQNYGRAGALVAFHDIAGEGQVQPSSGLIVEVPRLWRELKEGQEHVEFIAPGSAMGIGVLL